MADVAKYEGNDSQLNSVKDFIARGELGPFLPRYEGDYRLPAEVNQQAVAHYVQALEIRRIGHEAVSIFSGKIPHSVGVVPGGVTTRPTVDNIMAYIWKIKILQDFVNNVYIPDVLAVAGAYIDYPEIGVGCKNLLSYGRYDLEGDDADLTRRKRLFKQGTVSADLKPQPLDMTKITEQVKHSWYEDSPPAMHPSQGETKPQYGKEGRLLLDQGPALRRQGLRGRPAGRVAVTYAQRRPRRERAGGRRLDGAESTRRRPSSPCWGATWPGRSPPSSSPTTWRSGSSNSSRASRPTSSTRSRRKAWAWASSKAPAALSGTGSRLRTRRSPTTRRSCPPPGTSRRWTTKGKPGPIEQALIGTKVKDEKNPFEIVRIIRSFDPCLACSIH